MRAGRIRNAATIQVNTPSQDTIGGPVDSWATFSDPWWCELVQTKGGEAFRGRAVHASADSVAIGRYLAGVTAQMRLVLGSRTFDVLNVYDHENRHSKLELDLRERRI
jgi:head-tail adaptor